MKWYPTLRWEPITASDCIELGLSNMERWEALYLEWLGIGIVIVARPIRSIRA